MKKIFKKATIALMVVLFSATVAMAANGNRSGDRDGTGPDRDRARDGSCTSQIIDHSSNILLAADQQRAHDGSGDGPIQDRIQDCI